MHCYGRRRGRRGAVRVSLVGHRSGCPADLRQNPYESLTAPEAPDRPLGDVSEGSGRALAAVGPRGLAEAVSNLDEEGRAHRLRGSSPIPAPGGSLAPGLPSSIGRLDPLLERLRASGSDVYRAGMTRLLGVLLALGGAIVLAVDLDRGDMVVLTVAASHGLHVSDVLGLVAVLAGVVLLLLDRPRAHDG